MPAHRAVLLVLSLGGGWVLTGACSPSNEVQAVMADINGSFSPAYLAVGDRDSVSAKAFTKGYPSHIKFNSLQDPTSFTYHSSNASVLSVDSHGKVMALAPGTVTLTATCEGVSGDATVIVTPLAASLVVSPTLINAHVGDTVSVTVTAHDSLGTLVSGVVFFFSTDTTYWYAVGSPVPWSTTTPGTIRFRANHAGVQRVFGIAQPYRPNRHVSTDTIRIQVTP